MTPESQDNFPLRSVFLRMVWQMLFPEEGVLEVLFSHYTHTHTHTHTHTKHKQTKQHRQTVVQEPKRKASHTLTKN